MAIPARADFEGIRAVPASGGLRRARCAAALLLMPAALSGCTAWEFVQERGTEPVSEVLSSVSHFDGRFGPVTPPPRARPEGAAAQALAAALAEGCLAGLPDFATVADRLAARGWSVGAGGGEMRRAEMVTRVGGDDAAPSCRVEHPGVSREMARAIMLEQFGRVIGGAASWERGAGSEPVLVARRDGAGVVGIVEDLWFNDRAPGAAIIVRVQAPKAAPPQSLSVDPVSVAGAGARNPPVASPDARRSWHGGGCCRNEWEEAFCQGLVGASLEKSGAMPGPRAPQAT